MSTKISQIMKYKRFNSGQHCGDREPSLFRYSVQCRQYIQRRQEVDMGVRTIIAALNICFDSYFDSAYAAYVMSSS